MVHSYDSTGILEGLTQNTPTLAFWQNGFEHLRDSAKPWYQLLVDAGIVHFAPESVARTANAIWDDLPAWWHSAEVQTAREAFCGRYAVSSNQPVLMTLRAGDRGGVTSVGKGTLSTSMNGEGRGFRPECNPGDCIRDKNSICIFTENYYKGGVDTFLINLVNSWPHPGDEWILLCNRTHPGLATIADMIVRPMTIVRYRRFFTSAIAQGQNPSRFARSIPVRAFFVLLFRVLPYPMANVSLVRPYTHLVLPPQ